MVTGNTDTARYYTESYRMLNAVEHTKTRLATIENKFKQYVNSVNYFSKGAYGESGWIYPGMATLYCHSRTDHGIQGPDLSCTYSIFDPGAIDRTRNELVKAGEKISSRLEG